MPDRNNTTPPSGQKEGHADPRPPAAIQTVIPPAIRVQTPQHLYLDVPNLRCMSWSSQTPRGEMVHTQHKNTNICWRKVSPPAIRKDLQRIMPPIGAAPLYSQSESADPLASSSKQPPPSRSNLEAASSSSTQEQETPEPTELNFLRDRYFEININYGKIPKGVVPEPVNLVVDRYNNGHFKDLALLGGKETTLVRKTFHYELHDSVGNYHAIIPMGVLHQRAHAAVTTHLDRIFGPTVRVWNRYYGTFQNGHQSRMMNKLWENTQNGEGVKLVKRAWTNLSQASEASKDNEGKGKGPPPAGS